MVAKADSLPFKANTYDFIVHSHVIEHLYDPISAANEWLRIVKERTGVLYIIVSHKKRTFDKKNTRTRLSE